MIDQACDNPLNQAIAAALHDLADRAPIGPGGSRVLARLQRRTIRRMLLSGTSCLMTTIILIVAAGPIMLAIQSPAPQSMTVNRSAARPSMLIDSPNQLAATLTSIGIDGTWRWSVPPTETPVDLTNDVKPVATLDPTLSLNWRQSLLDNPILVGVLVQSKAAPPAPWNP